MNSPVDTSNFLLLGTAAVFLPLCAWVLLLAVRIRHARRQLIQRIHSVGDSPASQPENTRNSVDR
jgi:hypothetical protein